MVATRRTLGAGLPPFAPARLTARVPPVCHGTSPAKPRHRPCGPLHRNASCDALSKNLNNRGDSGTLVPQIGIAYHLFTGLFLAYVGAYAWLYRLFL